MLRILRIHNRLVIGGPTSGILNLAKYLRPDFETLLLAGKKEDLEEDATGQAMDMGISPCIIPEMGRSLHPAKDLKAWTQLNSIIRKFKPDIIHTHAAKPGAIGRTAGFFSKVPVIVHTYEGHVFHSYFGKVKTRFFLEIERTLAKRTDALIAISPSQKRELTERFKIAVPQKFEVIPLGFDLSSFFVDQERKRSSFRNEFNLSENCIAIGIVGRLVPIKNHKLFVEAIRYVKDNSRREIKAFIVGDGESKNEILDFAKGKALSCSERADDHADLIFTSWRKDIDIIDNGLDILCLTSLNEGTPVSLMEAQAAGKAVISTNVGGVQDIVINGDTALLSDLSDTQTYFQNLLRVVEDQSLRIQLGEKGRMFSVKEFGLQRYIQQHAELYHRLLGKKLKYH